MPPVIFVHVKEDESVETIIAKEPKPDLIDELPDVPTFDPEFKYEGTDEPDWVDYERGKISTGELLPIAENIPINTITWAKGSNSAQKKPNLLFA